MDHLIDPEIVTMLALTPTLGEVRMDNLAALRAARMAPDVKFSDAVEWRDVVIAGDPAVTVRVYRPKALPGPLPCVYSIHGGGYIMGSRVMDDRRFDSWCPTLGCVGVSVEYRLAPETPYPGPLEDCYTGLRWVHEHADELGIDLARTGIAGASAGGGLAAALALLARDRGELPVAFQLLIYPMIDDRQETTSSRWEVPVWIPASNRFGWKSYLGELAGSANIPPYAAASRCEDLFGLPPSFVCVGTLDGFLDEDVEYAQRLNHAGVPTELHVYPGAPHGFTTIAPNAPVSRRCNREIVEWLAGQLATASAFG